MTEHQQLRLRIELACQEALEALMRGEFQDAPQILRPVIDELIEDEAAARRLAADLEVLIDVACLCAARNPHKGSTATALFTQVVQLRLRILHGSEG